MKKMFGWISRGILIVAIIGFLAGVVHLYLQYGDIYISYPTDGYGVYESCPPHMHQQCGDRLTMIGKGGFSLVINYAQMVGSGKDELAYLQHARTAGVKIIWNFGTHEFWDGTDLRTKYPALAATCTCTNNDGFIAYVVRLAKNSSATWGYYVGDEPPMDKLTAVQHVSELIYQEDPDHPQLYVSAINQDTILETGAPQLPHVDVIAKEYYPVGRPNAGVENTGQQANLVQRIADGNRKASGMVLQAHNLGQNPDYTQMCAQTKSCRFPTVAEMQQMKDLTLKNAKPRLILWFSFYNTYPQDDAWQHLVTACGCGKKK